MQTLYTLLDQVVVTGAGQSIRLPVVTNDHLVECFYVDANASVSVVIVDLEMSLDPPEINDAAAKWYQMQQHTFKAGELTVKRAVFIKVNVPAQRIRANITTLTGEDGSDDKFTVRYSPLYMGRP